MSIFFVVLTYHIKDQSLNLKQSQKNNMKQLFLGLLPAFCILFTSVTSQYNPFDLSVFNHFSNDFSKDIQAIFQEYLESNGLYKNTWISGTKISIPLKPPLLDLDELIETLAVDPKFSFLKNSTILEALGINATNRGVLEDAYLTVVS